VCFAAGISAAGLLAVVGEAADTTTVDTTTSAVTTAPAETTQAATTVTEVTTTTVEQTTTQEISVPATTTAVESPDDGTPVWVWVLLAILAVALAAAVTALLARRGDHRSLSPEERGRRLDSAVGTWAAQGWAVESQTLDSAVLQRAGERMIVAVDASGQITTRPG